MLSSHFRTAATGAFLCLFVACLSVASPRSASAQLTSAQQSALKANCRSDFMSNCSGVSPGGKDALMCLQKNVDRLSAGCQTAVKATLPPPPAAAAPPPPASAAPPAAAAAPPPAAPAAPPPPKAAAAPAPQATPSAQQQAAIKQYCRSDFMSNCPGVSPGPGALQCLQQNAAKLSPACRTAIGASAPAPKAASTPKAATPKTAAPPPAAAAQPTAQQQAAIKQYCRSDFMSKCPGVSPGPGALQCLQRNAATLSPNCKSAVASLGGAPAAAGAPAAVGVAAQPTQQQISALKFSCRGDVRALCRGVPQGPEILGCLAGNEARLTPNCKAAVADIAQSMPDGATPAAPAAAAAGGAAAGGAVVVAPRGGPLRRAIRRRMLEQ